MYIVALDVRLLIRGEAEVGKTSCAKIYQHTIRVANNVLCNEENRLDIEDNRSITSVPRGF